MGGEGTEHVGPGREPGSPARRPAPGTRVAVYLSRAWWALVVVYGVLIGVVGPLLIAEQRDSGYCESIDHPGDCGSAGAAFGIGLLMVGVGAAGLFAAAALRAGRPWGRWATAGAFGLWALVAAALAVQMVVRSDDGGLDSDVVGPLIGMGLALTVVVLALRSGPT